MSLQRAPTCSPEAQTCPSIAVCLFFLPRNPLSHLQHCQDSEYPHPGVGGVTDRKSNQGQLTGSLFWGGTWIHPFNPCKSLTTPIPLIMSPCRNQQNALEATSAAAPAWMQRHRIRPRSPSTYRGDWSHVWGVAANAGALFVPVKLEADFWSRVWFSLLRK